jgi:hypothetical protein
MRKFSPRGRTVILTKPGYGVGKGVPGGGMGENTGRSSSAAQNRAKKIKKQKGRRKAIRFTKDFDPRRNRFTDESLWE